MHDIRAIRDDPAAFDAAMQRRGLAPVSEKLLSADRMLRAAVTQMQNLQKNRNDLSRQIGEGKRRNLDTSALELTMPTLAKSVSATGN